ncbi:MAG: hypothetical protein ABJE10_00820 [bacterium]
MLAGWQVGDDFAVRALAGPAAYFENGGSASAAGAEARLDLRAPLLPHLGLVLSGRAATLPNIRGGSVNTVAGTVGLRLH